MVTKGNTLETLGYADHWTQRNHDYDQFAKPAIGKTSIFFTGTFRKSTGLYDATRYFAEFIKRISQSIWHKTKEEACILYIMGVELADKYPYLHMHALIWGANDGLRDNFSVEKWTSRWHKQHGLCEIVKLNGNKVGVLNVCAYCCKGRDVTIGGRSSDWAQAGLTI